MVALVLFAGGFPICPCYIQRPEIQGQLFLNILSCLLISEKEKIKLSSKSLISPKPLNCGEA